MNHKYYLLPLLLCLLQLAALAQDSTTTTTVIEMKFDRYPSSHKRSYVTWGGDGPLLSSGSVKYADEHVRNIPRFTIFFNVGNSFNYDFGRNFGIFTGINIKNIGLITKDNDSVKLKRRVYTVGIPLGFKIGDLRHGSFFFFAGGSYDLAFNYKEKRFVNGNKVHKFNEWFSDRTALFMPSVFAGVRFSPGFGLKLQYYPNDFFNKDYKETVNGVTTKPNINVESKMFFATISYDFGGIPNHNEMKKHWKHKSSIHWEKN
jgi:hypothetical protein